MDLDNTEILATAVTPQNGGGARVWLESVSAGMRTVEAVIRELSQNDVPVLVVAEHGSGKAAAAARIHALSRRAADPFQVYQGGETSAEILAGSRWSKVEPSIFRKWGSYTGGAERAGSPDRFEWQWCWRRTAPCSSVHLWNLPRTRARGQGGQVPRGPILWNQRSLFAAASFAAAERRHSRFARLVSLGCCA